MQNTLVFKYGGSSLQSPDHIKKAAQYVAEHKAQGFNIIVVVSAMGSTTNDLIHLANQVANVPPRRELDMLISTGERVSMSLFSMALSQLGCPSISFTGSQAGILTTNSHSNASIVDIKPIRVEEELRRGKVIVLAGFQGVDPITKEITTLGRGGTDTSAVAMAAHFNAQQCIMMKDVEGILTVDPNVCQKALNISEMNLTQLFEMCQWGAKILHSRAVSLAINKKVPLVIRSYNNFTSKTLIHVEDKHMYEALAPIAINKYDSVITISCQNENLNQSLMDFSDYLKSHDISDPKILASTVDSECRWMLTCNLENLARIKQALSASSQFQLKSDALSAMTITYNMAPDLVRTNNILKTLKTKNIKVYKTLLNGNSISFYIHKDQLSEAINSTHDLEFGN